MVHGFLRFSGLFTHIEPNWRTGCLATIFLVTRNLFDSEQALRLTALASIYPPLIRATGRFYQEGIILILITLAVYSIIRAARDSKFSYCGQFLYCVAF